MPKLKPIVIFMGVAAVAGIGFLVFRGSTPSTGSGPAVKETASVVETRGDERETKGDEREKGDEGGKGGIDWTTYENSSFGFSLKHPQEFRVSEVADKGGQVILFQGPENRGFQIFISEFDEPGPVTSERIKQDLPNIKVEDAKEVLIGKDKNLRALIFFSQNELVGKTREVWFIWPEDPRAGGNFLYQVTTYPDLDNLMGPILETWKFNGKL